MSDTIAIGALRELTEHGIHVPDDVRLMGFDGIPFSACTNPPISTPAMVACTPDSRICVHTTTNPTT